MIQQGLKIIVILFIFTVKITIGIRKAIIFLYELEETEYNISM